jgi:hypothetical protein
MVIPRTAVLLAGRAVDVPSVDEISSKKSRYSASLWQDDRKKMADFHAPEGTTPDQMIKEFQKFMSGMNDEREKKEIEFAERLNEERRNSQILQEKAAFGLARISPAATFSLASTAIAGTGIHLKDEYKRSAEEYQKAFAEFIKGKTGVTPSGGFIFRINVGDEKKKAPINPMEIPRFEFRQQTLQESLGAAAVDFGILALFDLIFFAGAFIAFSRYDVR